LARLPSVCHAAVVATVDLVVTDLDGTLWAHEGFVEGRVLEAWHAIEERGVPILVATGRRLTSTREPLGEFGLVPPVVVLDGALGLFLESSRRFHERPIAPETGGQILEIFSAVGLSPVVYVDHPVVDAFVSSAPSTNPGHLERFGATVATGDLDDVVATESVLAFGLVGVDRIILADVVDGVEAERCGEARLNPSFDFGGGALTVVAHGLSKWDGVVAFCREAGIDPGRVLAIGDGANDVELLEHAAISCSLEGSSAGALEAAEYVVGSVAVGGWAEIVGLL
jgi:hydroxymethylpyrimidine pyrophosphatase-like HAD family hydrolase